VLSSVRIPKVYAVKLSHPHTEALPDVEHRVRLELDKSKRFGSLHKGASVAVAVGSRGIADIGKVVSACIRWLVEKGYSPVIIPAMGSHGGATGEGQRQILQGLGITEASVGAPIQSSMDVVELGKTATGVPCYFSKDAFASDAVLVINRVKSHTSFPREVESGLTKLVAVGLGKAKGAQCVHKIGPTGLRDSLPALAKIAIESAPIAYGLALVENGQHKLIHVEGSEPGLFLETDTRLLVIAKKHLSTLPFKQMDVLVVEKIGKEISGMGMDYAVVGRTDIRGIPNPETPFVHKIVTLELTAASKGNAQGMGVADFIPKRLIESVDLRASYMNALTASVIEKVRIPPVLPTDRDAIKAAIATSWCLHEEDVRLCVIESTLQLDTIYVSKPLAEEAARLADASVPEVAGELCFSEEGSLMVDWNR
jgi:hypothetical protein